MRTTLDEADFDHAQHRHDPAGHATGWMCQPLYFHKEQPSQPLNALLKGFPILYDVLWITAVANILSCRLVDDPRKRGMHLMISSV